MEPATVALLGGLLFLLIAIVGGGFTIREISMPAVPTSARAASLIVGAALIVPYFIGAAAPSPDDAGPDTAPPQVTSSREGIIYSDPEREVSPHELEVSGLLAGGDTRAPDVGDRIRIEYSLRNAGGEQLTFDETFIGARSPDGGNRDFAHSNQGRTLAPGDSLKVTSSIIVGSAGIWRFWPCYIVQRGGEQEYCPNRWRTFEVSVGG